MAQTKRRNNDKLTRCRASCARAVPPTCPCSATRGSSSYAQSSSHVSIDSIDSILMDNRKRKHTPSFVLGQAPPERSGKERKHRRVPFPSLIGLPGGNERIRSVCLWRIGRRPFRVPAHKHKAKSQKWFGEGEGSRRSLCLV